MLDSGIGGRGGRAKRRSELRENVYLNTKTGRNKRAQKDNVQEKNKRAHGDEGQGQQGHADVVISHEAHQKAIELV